MTRLMATQTPEKDPTIRYSRTYDKLYKGHLGVIMGLCRRSKFFMLRGVDGYCGMKNAGREVCELELGVAGQGQTV